MTAPSPALVAAADLIGKELTGESFQVFANLMESAGIWPEDSDEPTATTLDELGEDLSAALVRLRLARAVGDDLAAARDWSTVVRLRREIAALQSDARSCANLLHKNCRCVRPVGHEGECNCSYPAGDPQ